MGFFDALKGVTHPAPYEPPSAATPPVDESTEGTGGAPAADSAAPAPTDQPEDASGGSDKAPPAEEGAPAAPSSSEGDGVPPTGQPKPAPAPNPPKKGNDNGKKKGDGQPAGNNGKNQPAKGDPKGGKPTDQPSDNIMASLIRLSKLFWLPAYVYLDDKGKITEFKEVDTFRENIAEGIKTSFDKTGIKPSAKEFEDAVYQQIHLMELMGKVRLTIIAIGNGGKLLKELEGERLDSMMAEYRESFAKAEEVASLEDRLKAALEQLSKVNPGKFNEISSLMLAGQVKKGEEITPEIFVKYVGNKDSQEALLTLVNENLGTTTPPAPEPEPATD